MYRVKRTIGMLPLRWQQEFKRWWFRCVTARGKFVSPEPEFKVLRTWIKNGDWVLDVGANVGHYTLELSRIVGPRGRVLAFEPVPQTFELLASNMQWAGVENVTLFNTAVSSETAVHGINIPKSAEGRRNFYRAELCSNAAALNVIAIAIDSLDLSNKVAFVKVDVEGRELSVLKGMKNLLSRDHPVLVIEGQDEKITSYLQDLGYVYEDLVGSPNRIFK